MRYIKLMMLMVAAVLFASCGDDEKVNTNSVTVGFANETIVVKENVGYFDIPIKVEGVRNGDIHLVVEFSGTGSNPAQEEVNYRVTDKTLTLLNDTTSSEWLNVQVQTLDDQEINENREFTVTIVSAEGANIGRSSVTVTLRDNDAAFFEKFFGKWTLSCDVEGSTLQHIEKTVTISGPTDEDDPDYDHFLIAECPSMINVGVNLDISWRFRYSFDKDTKTGTLGVVMGEEVASYGSAYSWIWLTDDGTNYTTDLDYTATWKLGEGDSFPTTITFPDEDEQIMYLYQPGAGTWRYVYNFVMTKQ